VDLRIKVAGPKLSRLVIAFALPFFLGCTIGLPYERDFLLIGQVFPQECPVAGWLDQEPSFDYVAITTDTDSLGLSLEQAERYVRLFFPRTKNELFERFQFVVFPDANLKPLSGRQILWLKEGFQEHGISGFLTLGGDLANYGRSYFFDWQSSPLHDVLPIRLTSEQDVGLGPFHIKILKEDPQVLALFKPLGIERQTGSGQATPSPRQGATIWANAEVMGFSQSTPWLISWRAGAKGGSFWVIADDLDHEWWWPYGLNPNPYSGDVFLNIAFQSFGRRLPEDIELVHQVRTSFELFERTRLLILGAIELAEKFGANTYSVEKGMARLNEIRDLARERYASGEYEESLTTLREAGDYAEDLLDSAFKLKDQAMFYVYTTEWLVTTGVLLLSGSVLYSLMIRRSMYRSIDSTRFERGGR